MSVVWDISFSLLLFPSPSLTFLHFIVFADCAKLVYVTVPILTLMTFKLHFPGNDSTSQSWKPGLSIIAQINKYIKNGGGQTKERMHSASEDIIFLGQFNKIVPCSLVSFNYPV